MEKRTTRIVSDYSDEEVKKFDDLRRYCSMESMDLEILKAKNESEETIEKYKEYKEICLSNYRAAVSRKHSMLRQREIHEFTKKELEKFTELFKIKLLDRSYEFDDVKDTRLFKEIMIAFNVAGPGALLR